MATSIRIGALTDELITLVAKRHDPSSPRFKKLKTRVPRIIDESLAGRTDRFDIAKRLDGLQEKFQVVGNDALADALHTRLAELEIERFQWAPEVLSLLLELSDNPVSNSNLEFTPTLRPIDPPAIPTWSDFGTSELDHEDIWKDIDYAESSSDDNFSVSSGDISIPRIVPQSSKVPLNEYTAPDDTFLPAGDDALMNSIQNAQAWRNALAPTDPNGDSPLFLTELQVIRDVIFMLQGLPNSIFRVTNGDIRSDQQFSIHHASMGTIESIREAFRAIGVDIQRLRSFTQRAQPIPFMQTFQLELEKLILGFDAFLSSTQAQYSVKKQSSCVSLLALFDNIRRESKLLMELSSLVKKLKESQTQNDFFCLDLLYDLVCNKQAAAEDEEFQILSKILMKCFEVYAKPIRLWLKMGVLDESLGSFFIKKLEKSTDLQSLWREWFILKEVSGQLYGPKFLYPALNKIFTTGKTVIFLRQLGVPPESLQSTDEFFVLSMEHISPLAPFSGVLQEAFGRYVNSKHLVASCTLRNMLYEQCELWQSMQALDYIYLAKDTSLLAMVDRRIFELIDKGRQSWNDRFLLTENFQQALGNLSCVDPSRLIARAVKVPTREFERYCRSVKLLTALSLDYVLPWPVANIISKQVVVTYQRLSTFLLQIRRAKYVLIKQCANKPTSLRHEAHTREDILSFSIRHYLLWFVNIIYYHFTELVISSARTKMQKEMSETPDVDSMISVYQSFTSSLEEQCLLSKSLAPIFQAIISILDLCIRFSDIQVARYAEYQFDPINQSTTYIQLPSSRYRRRHRLASHEDDISSDDEEDGSEDEHQYINDTMFGDGNSTCISFAELSYRARLLDVRGQFEQLCGFLRAGLRGIGRLNGQSSWEMLADRLEWNNDELF